MGLNSKAFNLIYSRITLNSTYFHLHEKLTRIGLTFQVFQILLLFLLCFHLPPPPPPVPQLICELFLQEQTNRIFFKA